MTNSPPLKCKRCGDSVAYSFWGQLYCFPCRRIMISAETASISQTQKVEQDHVELALYLDRKRQASWDIRIIDERGQEVWARDLADRYRKELNARQHRDYRDR